MPFRISGPFPTSPLKPLSQFIVFLHGYSWPNQLQRRFILGPAKQIYVVGTLLSILISLFLYVSGRREAGIFVGLWAPTILDLGQSLVDEE
jgi:hypothetical protein